MQRLTKQHADSFLAKFKTWPLAEQRAWLLRATGPQHRELEGSEKDHMLTLLALIDPVASSNNQYVHTDEYIHNGQHYSIMYDGHDTTVIVEIIPETLK